MNLRNKPFPGLMTRLAKRLAACAPTLALAWLFLGLAAALPSPRGFPAGWRAQAQSDDAFEEALDKARQNLRQRNYDDALKFFKRANSMRGNNCGECLWGMAQAYSKLGAEKNVLETCDRVILAAADDRTLIAKAYNLKGVTLVDQAMGKSKPDEKKLAQAEVAFRKVLEADPEVYMARYNLGVTLVRLNREAEGLQELKAFVEQAVDDSDTAKEAQKMIENPRRARENYAPDFSVTTTEGEYIASDDLRGKVVLVDFWGTWCPPCVESVPSLVHLNKKFAKNPFVLISVSSDNDAAAWRNFIAKNKMTWAQYLDRTDKVQRAFQVNSFPTYVLIDHEGIIRYRSSGYSWEGQGIVEDAVKKVLKSLAKAPPLAPPHAPEPPASQPAAARPNPSGPPTVPNAPARPGAPSGESTLPDRREVSDKKASTIKLPTPVLEVLGAETMEVGNQRMLRYPLRLKNWASLPDEMFEPVKDLPPCGMGPNPTRLEVVIWSDKDQRLLGYCDMPHVEVFQHFWLILSPSQPSPEGIYITLKDRRSGSTIRSNTVALPALKDKTP